MLILFNLPFDEVKCKQQGLHRILCLFMAFIILLVTSIIIQVIDWHGTMSHCHQNMDFDR